MTPKKIKETTTVQIYRDDLKDLNELCKKGQFFRDKLHEMIKKEKKK